MMNVFRFTLTALAVLTLACSDNGPVAPAPFAGIAPGTTASHPGEGGRPISVILTGTAERPGPGDADGSGTATFRLNQGQGEICYELTVSNIAPATAAHIHIAPETDPGPVVVPLAAPTDGSSSGCAAVSAELIKAIRQNPENYYVNVHNEPFPGGAVRGQLSK